MRKELLPGLLTAAARNASRGLGDIALVEEGSVFLEPTGKPVKNLPVGNERPSEQVLAELNASIPRQPRHLAGVFVGDWIDQSPGQSAIESGYPQAVSAVQRVFAVLGLELALEQGELAGFHPGRGANVLAAGEQVGSVGELHPELSEEVHLARRVGIIELDLTKKMELAPEIVSAKEISAMPAATQDVSLVVALSVSSAEIAAALCEGGALRASRVAMREAAP